MLFNIHTLQWDEELLKLFDIPASMMPEVKSSSEVYGATKPRSSPTRSPSRASPATSRRRCSDRCASSRDRSNTYGTGCFLLMNSGEKPIASKNNLLTVAWKTAVKVNYALEGAFSSGVRWCSGSATGSASSAPRRRSRRWSPRCPTQRRYFVPALTGLAAPHWDQYARGAISGISRGTTAAHIARAALEGIAYQTLDIVGAMQRRGHHAAGAESRRRCGTQQPADAVQSDLLGKRSSAPA